MALVMSLAVTALVTGDAETAAKHLDGLSKLLDLYRGVPSLVPESLIDYKVRVVDFGVAVTLGRSASARAPTPSCRGSPSSRTRRPTAGTRAGSSSPRPDERLLYVWADLRAFSRIANEAAGTGRKMPRELPARVVTSVPQRLIRLASPPPVPVTVTAGEASDREDVVAAAAAREVTLHELLQVCMLAYVKVLLIKVKGVGKLIVFLRGRLEEVPRAWRRCLEVPKARIRGSKEQDVVKLFFWALVVATLSIFERCEEEEWLCQMLQQATTVLGLRSWVEAGDILKDFLWIDAIFDQLGRRIFEQWCQAGSWARA